MSSACRMVCPAVLIACALVASPASSGDGKQAPQAGAYEVKVKLELPHLEDATANKIAVICVTPSPDTYGLIVLSDNNPLATCPAQNVHRDGNTLTFDIVCKGGNAARASAKYVLAPTGFDGTIAMKMGGKNMTMTETQHGRRTGDCTGTDPPRS